MISPDNESRRELNGLIHREMQQRGDVSQDEHKLRVLDSRQDMTGADRQWAAQYEEGDVVRYTRGSKVLGIEPGEYARVQQVDVEREPRHHRARERRASDLRSAPTRRRGGVSRNRARVLRRRPRAVHSAIEGLTRCKSRAGHHRENQRRRRMCKSAWTQAARSRSISASIRISITVTQ